MFSNCQRNTCLSHNEKKLMKQRSSHPFPSPNTPNSGQQPLETLCAAGVPHNPKPLLWVYLHFWDTGWAILRGRDRWTEGVAPPCFLAIWDLLGASHSGLSPAWLWSHSPEFVPVGSRCAGTSSPGSEQCGHTSLPISCLFPLEDSGVQSWPQAPQETTRLELPQTFVPCTFLFSVELAHVVTEANFLC